MNVGYKLSKVRKYIIIFLLIFFVLSKSYISCVDFTAQGLTKNQKSPNQSQINQYSANA